MKTEKVKSLLHLAQKGRMLEVGKTAVLILIKRKKAALVIVALDSSEKLKREVELECRRFSIPLYLFGSKDQLGEILGRDEVAVIAVSNKNLASELKKYLL
ncbi:hypothetical protein B6D60_02740 [candidate division KSB1 bacterium 4484_87]|nr:MAG: hypothetical protein B6D60_02740 [candidate division KSB1 bacterium 4484_87]